MPDPRRHCFLALTWLSIGCGGPSEPSTLPHAAEAPPARASASPAPVEGAPPPSSEARPPLPQGKPCGELECLAFDTPEQAFDVILAENPRVLGVGEAHAQQSAPGVHSATRRFGERFLPKLKGRASDIVIELMIASGRCGKAREEAVAERQKPVTEPQAKTNQNQFVTLGTVAKSYAIEPHALEPTCEEYQAVLDAGPNDIARLLEVVKDATIRKVDQVLDRSSADPDQMVVVYGGALHNDAAPPPERAAWSFGPYYEQRTQGRYIELDLIVPEFIKDTEVWRALPWYPHYDAEKLGASTVLFRPRPQSFVLIFPRTLGKAPEAPKPSPDP